MFVFLLHFLDGEVEGYCFLINTFKTKKRIGSVPMTREPIGIEVVPHLGRINGLLIVKWHRKGDVCS